jgi:hypothetical protein
MSCRFVTLFQVQIPLLALMEEMEGTSNIYLLESCPPFYLSKRKGARALFSQTGTWRRTSSAFHPRLRGRHIFLTPLFLSLK